MELNRTLVRRSSVHETNHNQKIQWGVIHDTYKEKYKGRFGDKEGTAIFSITGKSKDNDCVFRFATKGTYYWTLISLNITKIYRREKHYIITIINGDYIESRIYDYLSDNEELERK